MTPSESYARRLERMTDQQILSILDSVVAEAVQADTPDDRAGQRAVLTAVFAREEEPVDVASAEGADAAAAARAGRELLTLLGEVPELGPSLDGWLKDPPTQEAAGVPLILAVPVVLTGCIVLLQVAGHTRFRRDADGRWTVDYNPSQRTPFDRTLRETVKLLADVVRSLPPGG